jgi:S1-C subfamily serine protease
VAGVGGVGVGFVTGRHVGPSTTTTSQSTNASGSTTAPGGSTYGGSGSGGAQDPNGFGDWRGSLPQLPTNPWSGGGGVQSESQSSGTRASGAALTGLVRVVSTMKYQQGKAAGTGMVLSPDGEVVTNHHVVEGATSVKVKVMTTGRTYTARVVGTDAKDDVAVLQLAGASGLATVTPDTSGVDVGEAVTAVGDGGGTVGHLSTVDGRVLHKGRSITTQSDGAATGERLTGLIEISNDVVPGYSGGATYDAQGEVVGMTTAASSGSSDIVGYAVPIAKVLRIAGDLESGVTSARYTYGNPAFLGVALANGTTVQGVYGGTPAATAGLSAGDRITRIGSASVTTTRQLRAAVAAYSPGDRVSVSWTGGDGALHTATVTLATGPVA